MEWRGINHVHLIGIGGVGISALARLLLSRGKRVSGVEDNESQETLAALQEQGVSISRDLTPEALPQADCYVYSDAWLAKHPELLEEARTRGVDVISYFEALGSITHDYKVIAVAGAHGKTTTTAMVADVLEAAGLDPTSVVGSLRVKTKSNYHEGTSDYFVVEADEYMRHFLVFEPYIVLITNIDADHLDYYADLADIESAFRALVEKVPHDGAVIADLESESVKRVVAGLSCRVINYRDYFDAELPLRVLPLHRINAAPVLALAHVLEIDSAVARKALADFAGTWRRFEYKGTTQRGAVVYDDYGHHPTEVRTTLASVREEFPRKRIVLAFHPHLYSRTKLLLNEFTSSFDGADEVVLAPIFAAREAPDPTISSEILAGRLRDRGVNARACDSLSSVIDYLRESLQENDLCITMGAGDIYKVADALTKQ